MRVSELIANELGVKIGEKFNYEDCECIVNENSLSVNDNWDALVGSFMAEILKNKHKIKKINSLADSWDIKEDDVIYFIKYTGIIDSAVAADNFNEKTNFIYNKNKEYMQLIADKQNLFRKMLRFADCNNGDFSKYQHCLLYDKDYQKWTTYELRANYEFMNVYFSSNEIAEKALEEFRDELERIRLAEIELRGN